MVAQITQFPLPAPDSISQSSEEFETSSINFVGHFPVFVEQANDLATEVNQAALDAEAAVEGLANAVWVTGTNYSAG